MEKRYQNLKSKIRKENRETKSIKKKLEVKHIGVDSGKKDREERKIIKGAGTKYKERG